MTRTSLAVGALLTALASSVKEKLLPGAATSDATATVINPENFKEESSSKQRAIVAGWIGGIRLIDNMEY